MYERDIDGLIRVFVSGSDVNGDAATSDFTSDAIPMQDRPWSLVFTFNGLTVTGSYPTLEIQGSNDPSTGANSWDTIYNGGPHTLPNTFKSRYCEYLYIRLVYLSNTATGGTIVCYGNQKLNK